MRVIYIFILSIILYSCTENIEQSYTDFEKYNQIDLRHKSWFPDFVGPDCYNFKEIHNLENDVSFGVLTYRNKSRIDSLLSDTKVYEKIKLETIKKGFSKITKPKMPDWFLRKDQIQNKAFYTKGPMYLINDDQNQKLYFVHSTL
jgi:hypothetical protein